MFSKKRLIISLLIIFFVLFPTLQTVRADSISVSAIVPTDANSYSAVLSFSNSDTVFPENKQLDYTITYGTTLSDPNPLTVQATWTQGTISGDTDPSIDVLQYVSNSATDAYGATHPVIDPIKRTITWTINNFPANTQNQVVHFSLITTSNYTTENPVSFSVSGRVIGLGTQTPDSTIVATYKYNFSMSPRAPIPTQSAPTTTYPTPTSPIATPFVIQQISMQTISQNKANIFIQTSFPSQITISYGTNTNRLNTTLIDQTRLSNHSIQIDNLNPQTHYYFQIIATNTNGQIIRSDLYTFLTAHVSEKPTIDQNSLTLIDNNVIVFDQGMKDQMNKNIAVVTQKTIFNFSFTVPNSSDIVSIQSFLRKADVLGASSFAPAVDAASQLILLAEVESGIYHGTFIADQPAGKYFLVARIIDKKGNLSEQNLVNLHIIQPLLVRTAKTNTPIEHAQLILYYQSASQDQFNLLVPEQIPISNPVYSNTQGAVILPLPQGKYKAHVSASGYQSQNVIFTISSASTDGYPTVSLKQLPFNLLTFISYVGTTGMDALTTLKLYVQNAAYSDRFITLIATILSLVLTILTLIAFRFKHGLPIYILPLYVFYHSKQLLSSSNKNPVCHGIVTDAANNQALPGVQLHFGTVFATTNRLGEFAFSLPKTTSASSLRLSKHGYQTTIIKENIDSSLHHPLQLSMQKNIAPTTFLDYIKWVTVDLLESLFTTLLLLSFLFEILLGYIFGWESVVVFLAISLANLLLWLKHVYYVYARTGK